MCIFLIIGFLKRSQKDASDFPSNLCLDISATGVSEEEKNHLPLISNSWSKIRCIFKKPNWNYVRLMFTLSWLHGTTWKWIFAFYKKLSNPYLNENNLKLTSQKTFRGQPRPCTKTVDLKLSYRSTFFCELGLS